MSPEQPNDSELRERAGGEAVISFMELHGFRLTQSEHNTYGYWFKESEPQMTEGLTQASFMHSLIQDEILKLKTQHDKEIKTLQLKYAANKASAEQREVVLKAKYEDEILKAHTQGWHEGRAAANNPEIQYGYASSVNQPNTNKEIE